MNHLSKAQWKMLGRSAVAPVSVFENANTIAALYTRSMVKFTGIGPDRGVVPTKFGATNLHLKKAFGAAPTFKKSRIQVQHSR